MDDGHGLEVQERNDAVDLMPSPEELRDLLSRVQRVKQDILIVDLDYGVIPGTGSKPTLLKPGAEKMCQFFGYRVSSMDMQMSTTEPFGVLYKCTLTDGRGRVVGVCDGWCDEAEKIRSRYTPPRNTVIKMAQKRAFVGATLIACNASELFTQDVEDFYDATVVDHDTGEVVEKPKRSRAKKVEDAVEAQLDNTPADAPDVTKKVSTSEYGLAIYQDLVDAEANWIVANIPGMSAEAAETQAKANVAEVCKAAGYKNSDEIGAANGAKQILQLALAGRRAKPVPDNVVDMDKQRGESRLQQIVETYKALGPEKINAILIARGAYTPEALNDAGMMAGVDGDLKIALAELGDDEGA